MGYEEICLAQLAQAERTLARANALAVESKDNLRKAEDLREAASVVFWFGLGCFFAAAVVFVASWMN